VENNKKQSARPIELGEAWRSSDLFRVSEVLRAWQREAGENDLECWLQAVYADSLFERDTLAASVERAEILARKSGDEIALARIAACVVDANYSDWLPARSVQRWLDVLRGVAFARLQTLPLVVRLEIAVGILAADLYGEQLSTAEHVAACVIDWCREGSDVHATARGNVLGYALEYFSSSRDWQRASQIVEAIDALANEPGFGALMHARVAARRSFYFHYRRGDYAGALAQSTAAIEFAKQADVGKAAREAGITVTLCRLMRGEVQAADRALAAELASIPEGHLMMRANVHYERAWWHALQRNVVAAQKELDLACKLFAEIDEHGVMSLATPSLQAQLLVQVGEYESALRVYETRMRRPDAWVADIALIEALAALESNDSPRVTEKLREGLAVAARIDIKGVFWACRDELKRLFDNALRENIAPAWVESVRAARLL
jgi:tetratricopeptide (TPR) repeat protein